VLARAAAEEAFRVASPIVTQFGRRLASNGHVVAYFDAEGVMLALDGNHATRSRLADVNFAPGACWAEDAAGTNGIGTALIEGRPIEVFASEHFVEAWQPWTCASVPVRCGGRIVGLVDITSPWTAYNASLLLTAEALGRAIESQLAAVAAQRESAELLRVAHDAVRARDDFLDVASHELRTPLTPLQLRLQSLQRLLARAGHAVDRDQLVDGLRRADRDVGRIVQVIDELLDVSRLAHEPLRLTLSPTDLGAIVRSVVQRHQRELDHQGCEVAVVSAYDTAGRWDASRIEQVFEHLLLNAMKYAPGRIDVEICIDSLTARLLVRDHGPGIPPEDLERVFLPFERAVSYRHIAGFGLGLHVVRQVAEAHGGRVQLSSTLRRGSTVVVELPREPTVRREGAAQGLALAGE
jgi:signal transduction histidine kinase